MSADPPRVWHRHETVPHGTRVRDGLGRPWWAHLSGGVQTFTDGMHRVPPADIEYPVEEA